MEFLICDYPKPAEDTFWSMELSISRFAPFDVHSQLLSDLLLVLCSNQAILLVLQFVESSKWVVGVVAPCEIKSHHTKPPIAFDPPSLWFPSWHSQAHFSQLSHWFLQFPHNCLPPGVWTCREPKHALKVRVLSVQLKMWLLCREIQLDSDRVSDHGCQCHHSYIFKRLSDKESTTPFLSLEETLQWHLCVSVGDYVHSKALKNARIEGGA